MPGAPEKFGKKKFVFNFRSLARKGGGCKVDFSLKGGVDSTAQKRRKS